MKKIFAKELAALAVLALAFTGCNTAFDGTNANFSEKESQYTDISGATASFSGDNYLGKITHTGSIAKNNNKNVITVTITSFSKINVESADKAIHFQQLTNNTTAGYYKVRGADLPKTRIKVDEQTGSGTFSTTITYEVNGTGVTANQVALFVDAKELKTKGGSAVLALDGNPKRGEESDSYIDYLSADGTTPITGVDEDFRPTYSPISGFAHVDLIDSSSKYTGKTRIAVNAGNKKNTVKTGEADDWETGLEAKLNESVVFQYREPGKREYSEKKLSWTYHNAVSTASPFNSDPYAANSYTADVDLSEYKIGTEWRIVQSMPAGLTAPAWYKDAYNHPAIVYVAGSDVGAKAEKYATTYTLHKTVPTYITISDNLTTGSDISANYTPTNYAKSTIESRQAGYFSVTATDNWFQVSTTTNAKLDPNNAKDFIVVDANNKKIAADVEVITKSYNDSTTGNGDVEYVKITVKDVRYRNNLPTAASGAAVAQRLHVAVGKGTKVVENKSYPSMVTFGVWEDVADDDCSGYCKIN